MLLYLSVSREVLVLREARNRDSCAGNAAIAARGKDRRKADTNLTHTNDKGGAMPDGEDTDENAIVT